MIRAAILLLLIFKFGLKAQSSQDILMTNPEIQFEITEAVNQMYNFQFQRADSQFRLLKKRFPAHPLPYFLLGYSQYWRILPNEDLTLFDDQFFSYMDTVIELSEKIYQKEEKKIEAVFFLTAAYAFKGRLLSDRERWTASVFAGKNALKYLKIGREYNDLSPEFLFGEGLFNYFAEWIPENYKAFKMIMWLFPKGNKKEGIKYLKQASNLAFYTRTEAQHYYTKIMLFEEKNQEEVLPTIQYLVKTYPDNPVFHRLLARVYFNKGNYSDCEKISLEIIQNIDSNKFGYEAVSGRYASFFLGWIYRSRDKEKSKKYFQRAVHFSEEVKAYKMNYYLYALSALAQMADQEKDKKSAFMYHEKIKNNAGRKNELYKQSKKYLDEND